MCLTQTLPQVRLRHCLKSDRQYWQLLWQHCVADIAILWNSSHLCCGQNEWVNFSPKWQCHPPIPCYQHHFEHPVTTRVYVAFYPVTAVDWVSVQKKLCTSLQCSSGQCPERLCWYFCNISWVDRSFNLSTKALLQTLSKKPAAAHHWVAALLSSVM